MNYKPHKILLAIDGTDSQEWCDDSGENSHVRRFFHSFPGTIGLTKRYMPGPEILGLEIPTIVDDGIKWILNSIRPFLQKGSSLDDISINLVGHSRGGLAVIMIANRLENLAAYAMRDLTNAAAGINEVSGLTKLTLSVDFMGLYDAVDRAAAITALDVRLTNVAYVAHAKRLNRRLSRPSFSVIDVPGGLINKPKEFDTSHGGVGGDPGFFTPLAIKKDVYCNAINLLEQIDERRREKYIPSGLLNTSYAWFWQKLGGNERKTRIEEIKKYWTQSIEADKFVREHANNAGLHLAPFQHTPWNTKENEFGKELMRLTKLTPTTT